MGFRLDLNMGFDRLEQRIAEMGGERRYPVEERLKLGEGVGQLGSTLLPVSVSGSVSQLVSNI